MKGKMMDSREHRAIIYCLCVCAHVRCVCVCETVYFYMCATVGDRER